MASLASSSRGAMTGRGRCYSVVALLVALFVVATEAFLVAPGARARSSSRSMAQRITGLTRVASSVQERQSTTTAAPRAPQQQQQPPQGEEEGAAEQSLLPASFFESLPWSHSITGAGKETLLYMPFVEEQIRHLEAIEGPGGVKPLPVPPTVAYTRSERKAAHMASFCVETADFRKVRFTYMDGGAGVQVFNSVWYPRFDTDAPILGVDLLLFGGHKMLAVVDYQPLSHSAEYKARYLDHLAPVKARYPALGEAISNRYYEDTRWFSEQMLFGRLQDPAEVASTLMPAFQEYLAAYTALVRGSRQQQQQGQQQGLLGQLEMDAAAVQARHQDYDEYNLVRDPAGKLFEAYFGKPFAKEMLGFLFELADPAALEAHEAVVAAAAASAAGAGAGAAAAAAGGPPPPRQA